MKKNLLFSLLLCFFIIPVDSQAQITNYLKKQANRFVETAVDAADKKVTKKVDEKATEVGEKAVEGATKAIEREADKASQAISDAYAEADSATGSTIGSINDAMSALSQIGTVSLPHADKYDFKGQIVMETKLYDSAEDTEPGIMNMILWTGAGNDNFSVINEFVSGDVEEENLNIISIADNVNKCYVILMGGTNADEGGFGVISPIPEEQTNTASESSSSEANNISKSGKTKTIAGIKCNEYVYNDGVNRSVVWIADQSKFNFSKSQLIKAGLGSFYSQGVDGFVMGYEGYINDILFSSMEITKIDDNATKSFSLANYMLMQGEE